MDVAAARKPLPLSARLRERRPSAGALVAPRRRELGLLAPPRLPRLLAQRRELRLCRLVAHLPVDAVAAGAGGCRQVGLRSRGRCGSSQARTPQLQPPKRSPQKLRKVPRPAPVPNRARAAPAPRCRARCR